jgi:hypothetical protein
MSIKPASKPRAFRWSAIHWAQARVSPSCFSWALTEGIRMNCMSSSTKRSWFASM